MRTVFILVILFFFLSVRAQSNVGMVNPAGFTLQNDSIVASVSIGEHLIQTIRSSSLLITQGFLQTDPETTQLQPVFLSGNRPAVYPNPFDKQLQISSSVKYSTYCLYDVYGKLIESDVYNSILNLEHLNASTYLLVLYSDNLQVFHSFKIVKLY